MITSKDIGVIIHLLGKHKVAIAFSSLISVSFYILWPLIVSSKKRNNQRKPIGLPNYGNTCFLNSLLQALASCDQFISSMESHGLQENKLMRTLYSILQVLGRPELNSNPFCPTAVLDVLREKNWVISADQQDTYELFSALVQSLREEVKHTEQGWLLSSLLRHGDTHCNCVNASYIHRVPLDDDHNCRKLNPPMGGQLLLATRLSCSSCSHSPSLSLQAEESISLALPHSNSFIHPTSKLETLLFSFFQLEELEGSRCEACSKGRLLQQIQLLRLPASLFLHIKRTGWLSGLSEPYKRSDPVIFPLMLNMTPYLYSHTQPTEHSLSSTNDNLDAENGIVTESGCEPNSPLNNNINDLHSPPKLASRPPSYYILKAVIVHLGEPCSGHFTTYRYWRGQWWCLSDNDVQKSSQEEVLATEAYMLFYERSTIVSPSSNGTTDLRMANGHLPSVLNSA